MMRTVLSAKPTARKRDLCSPAGTFASAIHTASDGISLRSVYSLSCPVYKPTFCITEKQELQLHLNITFLCIHTQRIIELSNIISFRRKRQIGLRGQMIC